ncbi:MAG TPA: phytoene desaturase family protein [Polyangiaceae bacterium]|nr:phytoene desaturase family protein [Polyangiaceae bacterium]
MQSKHVVIVGAGPGGLCAAMLLATRGLRVTVLEKRAQVGGRSGGLSLGPYHFDSGSTMLMMRFIADEMFALAGQKLSERVELIEIDPMYRLDFNGRQLDMYAELEPMRRELERFAPGSSAGLARFLGEEHTRLEHLYPLLQRPWSQLSNLASLDVFKALPDVGLFRSLYETASSYFEDEALRLAFSFQAAYLGMSPWDCPGGFCMVPYVEHAWGVQHIKGGIQQLCREMASVAREAGASLYTQAEVVELISSGQTCTQVRLADGRKLDADYVVVDADATRALLDLLKEAPSARFTKDGIAHQLQSCSTFMIYLGLDELLPLAHNTFFFADDYRAEMRNVFEAGTLDDDLSLYVCNPSRLDRTLAPVNHSALYLLALVPNTHAKLNWAVEQAPMQRRMFELFKRRAGYDLEPHIQAKAVRTPLDWQRDFNVSHGAVFGPAHSIDQLLAFRLPNRLPWPSNVLLTGAGTNPGSGLPTILESGRIAAREIASECGLTFPPTSGLPEPVTWNRARLAQVAGPA